MIKIHNWIDRDKRKGKGQLTVFLSQFDELLSWVMTTRRREENESLGPPKYWDDHWMKKKFSANGQNICTEEKNVSEKSKVERRKERNPFIYRLEVFISTWIPIKHSTHSHWRIDYCGHYGVMEMSFKLNNLQFTRWCPIRNESSKLITFESWNWFSTSLSRFYRMKWRRYKWDNSQRA